METKPLGSNVKHPLHIRIGDHKVEFHSGCSVVDVTFPNVFYVEINEIHFKNYCTYSLSVLVKQKDTSSGEEPKWKVAVKNMQLMPCAHSDQGSEDYFTISPKLLAFPLTNILGVRFVLRQPSPVWKEFKIEDIKIFKAPYQVTQEMSLPSWLSDGKHDKEQEEGNDKQFKNHGLESVNALSRDLQSLWALSEQSRANQTAASLGRYDVEGSYEINLLSYT